jgi:lysophospholipase L1-like esterase
MKSVLCYGDSNTWGYIPGSGERYPLDQRWPGVLQAALGPDFRILEEGLNSRTTVVDDPIRGGAVKNGLTYLRPCLESHAPLDLVILLLGTNDLKHRFSFSAYDIAANVACLVGVIQQSGAGVKGHAPRVLVMSPPHVGPLSALSGLFDGAVEKSRHLAKHYQTFANQLGCPFLDVASVVTSSPIDGVHWAADQHRNLGNRVAELARAII